MPARPRRLHRGVLRVTAAALCVAGLFAGSAGAQMPGPVRLEELTWTELRERVRSGTTTLLIPIGGTEQNGVHMALGKHNVRVVALSVRIAHALGNALVGPVMTYVPEGALDPPTGHMRFPGTMTVPEDVFRRILESAVRSARLHGFRDIVLLGDHGSTQAGQRAVAARLNREWAGAGVRVHAGEEYYRAATAGFAALLRAKGYRDDEIGSHAGLADTALMLAIEPNLVRALPPGDRRASHEVTGADGDPSRATAALGRLGVELIVAATVEAITQSTQQRAR